MRPRVLTICLGAMGIVIACVWSSCGPSIRRTYQSDNAFERCFDRDFDPQVPAREKSACWGDWLSKHLYNQPDDKIRYAEMRRMEIAQGKSVPGPPGVPGAFDHRPRLLVDPNATTLDAGDAGEEGDAGAVGRVLATSGS